MTTRSRILAAAAATTLGAVVALSAAAPATAKLPDDRAVRFDTCQTLGGGYSQIGSEWFCKYSATQGTDPQPLVDLCHTTYLTEVIRDGTLRFTCYG